METAIFFTRTFGDFYIFISLNFPFLLILLSLIFQLDIYIFACSFDELWSLQGRDTHYLNEISFFLSYNQHLISFAQFKRFCPIFRHD